MQVKYWMNSTQRDSQILFFPTDTLFQKYAKYLPRVVKFILDKVSLFHVL